MYFNYGSIAKANSKFNHGDELIKKRIVKAILARFRYNKRNRGKSLADPVKKFRDRHWNHLCS